MVRRLWLWSGVVVLALVAAQVIDNGRSGPGALWLDGVPDASSDEVAVFVWGGCDPDREEIRSISVEETPDSVVVDLTIRWPFGLGGPSCGSYQGMPYELLLETPLGDRVIYILNPDSSITPVLLTPFAE